MEWKCLSLITITCLVRICKSDIMEIYNTRLATSDLQWSQHSVTGSAGWEEVSGFDHDYKNTIRSHQICQVDLEENNNWIRSPFIASRGGKRIQLDVEFSINRCSSKLSQRKTSNCKETFNIFYYEADLSVASSTFPPWKEHPYVKIDTVAGNADSKVNKKTFSFGPLSRNGVYIAIQDQGACMSVIAIRVYYYYCSETTKKLVAFPKTISGAGVALVSAEGTCTENAELATPDEELKYRCSSDGQWKIQTGRCRCRKGYQANRFKTGCYACREGTYKIQLGLGSCIPCPPNSGLPVLLPSFPKSKVDKRTSSKDQCPCHAGYARANDEDISVACTRPPSKPHSLTIKEVNSTSAKLQWYPPEDNGGRDDVFYRFGCKTSVVTNSTSKWDDCSNSVAFLAPSLGGNFSKNFVQLAHLRPHRYYLITIFAENGVSTAINNKMENSVFSEIKLQTKEAAPLQVTDVTIVNQTATTATLSWQPPTYPNGVITSYEIEYLRKQKSAHSSQIHKDSFISDGVVVTQSNTIHLTELDKSAVYQVRIRARTSAGFGPHSKLLTINPLQVSNSQDYSFQRSIDIVPIVGGACGVLLVIFIVAVVYKYRSTGKLFCLNKRGVEKQTTRPIPSNESDELLQQRLVVNLSTPRQEVSVAQFDPQTTLASMLPEVDPGHIKVEHVIGTGEFAEVWKGILYSQNEVTNVAVKRLKSGATEKDKSNFLREASIMAKFNDPNVIQMKGVIIKTSPVMIISEYMEHRSLKAFLELNRGKLSILQLVKMLKGIASGMKYLSNMKHVHRDLAARNILVNSELVCKVSDFGLSRNLENDPNATYTTQGGKIAVRWTAPESILFRTFTSASDVWSYGIVMWEVMSYGEKPYWDMSNDDVIKNIQEGLRLPMPVHCPKSLHDSMIACWQAEPAIRPTFNELFNRLSDLLQQPNLLRPENHKSAIVGGTSETSSTPSTVKHENINKLSSVEEFLEAHHLGDYIELFKDHGIDNLEKVSNLTPNDLKSIGVHGFCHIDQLDEGIKNLQRYFAKSSSSETDVK